MPQLPPATAAADLALGFTAARGSFVGTLFRGCVDVRDDHVGDAHLGHGLLAASREATLGIN